MYGQADRADEYLSNNERGAAYLAPFVRGAEMLNALISPLIIGVAGASILIALGVWQVQRLTWKTGVLDAIEARMADAPKDVPIAPDKRRDRYAPVELIGRAGARELHVLVSHKKLGAGFRIITSFADDTGRRVLIDQGFVASDEKSNARTRLTGQVSGNLHWPDDRTGSTPANDLDANIWFARDIAQMAEQLGATPVLVILRAAPGLVPAITPLPLDASAIPSNHLEYAITWFSLATVWLGMTAFWVWRIKRQIS